MSLTPSRQADSPANQVPERNAVPALSDTQVARVSTPIARDTVLVSHANPEDNEFARWLALQLANHGYRVWCDLTKLLGGEVFWDDIEAVIRERAAKVVFALSRTSNSKDGALREVQLAQSIARREKLKDFIIPVRIDDLPTGEITIELTRLNVLPFNPSWAAGLSTLLTKLETEGVPKDPAFNCTAVNTWWRSKFGATRGLTNEVEEYLSNWFPVSVPDTVFRHRLSRHRVGLLEAPKNLPYPAITMGPDIVTFARAEDFAQVLGDDLYVADTVAESLTSLLEERGFGRSLFWLLRLAWEQALKDRSLPMHELANKAKAFFFRDEALPGNRVYFTGMAGARTFRQVVGFSSRATPSSADRVKRYWHFGLEARPLVHPVLAYVMKPHVVFSSDGVSPWSSSKRLAAARRSECKDWWNDDWRDRTLAAMRFLSDGESGIVRLRLGSDVSLAVQSQPLCFSSPVAYVDPQAIRKAKGDGADDYGHDADDDDPFSDDLVEE